MTDKEEKLERFKENLIIIGSLIGTIMLITIGISQYMGIN